MNKKEILTILREQIKANKAKLNVSKVAGEQAQIIDWNIDLYDIKANVEFGFDLTKSALVAHIIELKDVVASRSATKTLYLEINKISA
jgi:hypothetical protein